MKIRRIFILLLVLLLTTQNLALAAGSGNNLTSEMTIGNNLIITSSETWTESTSIQQNVIVGPNATLTINSGAVIQLQGDLIIYGKVQNNGKIYMNGHDVKANYVNMGGIKMSGDSSFPNIGIFDPYGFTTDVGYLGVNTSDYPTPPVELTSPIQSSTVSTSSVKVEGRTVPGFNVSVNGKQTVAGLDGAFSLTVDLVPGENTLPIIVKDSFTREYKVQDLQINYVEDHEPPASPTVDPFDDTLTALTGSGEVGSTISVMSDFGIIGEIKIDRDGKFSVEIGKRVSGEVLSVTATDQAGNTSESTQVIVQDKSGPLIQSTSPADQDVLVPIDSTIRINFNENIQQAANFTNIEVFNSSNEGVAVEKSISGKELDITPAAKLDFSTTYTVKIPAGSVQDISGNEIHAPAEFSFQTEEFSTKVSGGIYENTKWTKDKSPYVVTGDMVVFPDATLTIEPGVIVLFSSNVGLTIRGKLIAEGTEADKIRLTAKDQGSSPDWKGINIDTELGGTVSLKNTEVSNANIGVSVGSNYSNINSSPLKVVDSTFKGNTTGISSGHPSVIINNSTFTENTTGVSGSVKEITGSVFDHNTYGANLNLEGYVYNSQFTNNKYGIKGMANVYKSSFYQNDFALSLSMGNVRFNDIENNIMGIEISASAGSVTVSNNQFIDNQTGIDLQREASETIKSNSINNYVWNVKNETKYTKDLSSNYWGTTDEAVIKEKIFDGYDDINKGLVTYKPLLGGGISLNDTKPPTWNKVTYVRSEFYEESGTKKIRVWGGTATDDMSVKNYNLYIDDMLIGTEDGPNYSGVYDFEVADYSPGDYKFRVEAVDFEGNISSDGPSGTISVPDNEAPVWPSNKEVKVLDKDATSVTLQWTPASDNVKVEEYIIHINTMDITVPGDTTTYKVTNLKPWQTYDIQIQAKDASGNQANEGLSLSVALEDHNPPQWPNGAVLWASDLSETGLRLNWPIASDDDAVDYYEIYINDEYVSRTSESSYDVSGLSPSTEYTFMVKAIDRTGNNVSEPLSLTLTTLDTSVPYWPEGSFLTADNISETEVQLSWPAAEDNAAVTSYRIKQNGNIIDYLGEMTTSYTVKGLTGNTEYEFTIEAGDSAGNWSSIDLTKKVKTKDLTAPAAPIVNDVNDQSLFVTGMAEAGSAVSVKAGGDIIATGISGMDGRYSIAIPLQKAGTELEVSAADSAGNRSTITKVSVRDVIAPSEPTIDEVTDQSTSVTGIAEAGSVVTVLVAEYEIETVIVGSDGKYSVNIRRQLAGNLIQVFAKDGAGNLSTAAKVTVIDVTAPSKPSVNEVTDQSEMVTGTAEPGSVITVMDGDKEIGSGIVEEDGNFSIAIPHQNAGSILKVLATDQAGNSSTAANVTVKDVTAPSEPMLQSLTDQTRIVTGTAEPMTVIKIMVGGMEIGTTTTQSDGTFTVTIPKQKAHTRVEVVAIDLAGNRSSTETADVWDVTPPDKPQVNEVTNRDTAVTGQAEPWAYIEIKVNGRTIDEANANSDGHFAASIPIQAAGTAISLTAIDMDGNRSDPVTVVVKDVIAPEKPSVNEVTNKDTMVTGHAEAGSKIEVKVAESIIGVGKTDVDGQFNVGIPVQDAETEIIITATDQSENVSESARVVVKDIIAPEKPSVNEVTDKDSFVTGEAEPATKVEVKVADTVIGEGKTDANGQFKVEIPVQKAETELVILSTDQSENVSDAVKVVVKDVTAPEKPKVDEITDKNASVTGQAEAGSKVEVKVNGEVIGTETAGADGKFTVDIPFQTAGTELVITAADKAGNVSEETKAVVTDVTAPAKPEIHEVTDKDPSVTGEAESDSKVEVKVNGEVIGSGTAGTDDKFTVDIPAQTAGTELVITSTDNAGNTSEPTTVVVKDVTSPAKPEIHEVTDKDTSVSGEAEVESKVEAKVNGEVIGTGTAGLDGKFSVRIPVQKAGTKLVITAIDKAGNVSEETIMLVKDVTAPILSKVNTIIDQSKEVTGSTEAGATVMVLIGTSQYKTKADTKGNFRVAIPQQKAGVKISISATDGINVSKATVVTVLDKTAPVVPTVNEVSNKVNKVTGKTEALATVTVTIGTKKYTAKADGKGYFAIIIPTQKAGTKLYVTAKDGAGNISTTKSVIVIDKIAPTAPKISTFVRSTTKEVYGTAEAYSTITIKAGNKVMGTAKADAKGKFRVKIKGQKKNTFLYVTAMDQAKNVSGVTKVRVY